MDDLRTKDDFVRLAVIDAYKGWLNTDFGFLQQTKILTSDGERSNLAVGEFNREVMRRIAKAYTVSRNIPSHSADGEAEKLVSKMNASEFGETLRKDFKERAGGLLTFVSENPVCLAEKDDGAAQKPKELASALSKLSWFLRPEDWTIFDKFVGAAVLRKQGSGSAQMGKYYDALVENWNATSSKLCEAAEAHGFNRLLGYRIIDKYLFFHGVGMWGPVADGARTSKDRFISSSTLEERLNRSGVRIHRASLLATEAVLAPHLGEKLKSLADAAAHSLRKANWVSKA